MTMPEAAEEAVATVLDRIYDCLGKERFADLAVAIGLDRVHIYGRDEPAHRFAECVADRLRGADDISLFMLRILEQRAEPTSAVYRGTACLLWSDPGSWEDHELEFDVTAELVADPSGEWRLSHLGIAPPTPEKVPFPEDPAPTRSRSAP